MTSYEEQSERLYKEAVEKLNQEGLKVFVRDVVKKAEVLEVEHLIRALKLIERTLS